MLLLLFPSISYALSEADEECAKVQPVDYREKLPGFEGDESNGSWLYPYFFYYNHYETIHFQGDPRPTNAVAQYQGCLFIGYGWTYGPRFVVRNGRIASYRWMTTIGAVPKNTDGSPYTSAALQREILKKMDEHYAQLKQTDSNISKQNGYFEDMKGYLSDILEVIEGRSNQDIVEEAAGADDVKDKEFYNDVLNNMSAEIEEIDEANEKKAIEAQKAELDVNQIAYNDKSNEIYNNKIDEYGKYLPKTFFSFTLPDAFFKKRGAVAGRCIPIKMEYSVFTSNKQIKNSGTTQDICKQYDSKIRPFIEVFYTC